MFDRPDEALSSGIGAAVSPVGIDASVFLNAFRPSEESSPSSRAFLERVRQTREPMILPTLLLPEVAAVLSQVGEPREVIIPLFVY